MASVPGLLVGIARKYLDPDTFPAPFYSSNIYFGPQDFLGDGIRYYKTKYKFQRDNAPPPGAGWIWTRPDRLFIMDSNKLPEGDGLYTFRVVGYRQAAHGTLVDERVMPLCGTEDDEFPLPSTVMIRTDNRTMADHPPSIPSHPWGPGTVHLGTLEPDCDIVSVIKNEGSSGSEAMNACGDAVIVDTDSITIHFKVTTPISVRDAHLLAYQISLHWGESVRRWLVNPSEVVATQSGDPTVHYPHYGPTYVQALAQGATRPFWSGGNFKVTIPGSAFPVSCAYMLRLRAWKRTTHGCSSPYNFHWNICEYSFCVVKP